MRLRHTSIRVRMFLLVLVPLLALIGVYAYAVANQFGTAVGLANAGKVSGTTIAPISDAMVALNAERGAAVRYLAAPSGQALAALQGTQVLTDRAFRVVKTITKSGPVTANATQLDKAAAAAFITDDEGALQALRTQVASGAIGRTAAINAYSSIMADGVRVAEQSLQETYVSQSLATTAREEVALYQADMLAMEENDIYSGDMMTGHMPAADQKEFAQLAAVRRFLVMEAVPQLDAEASGLLRKDVPASLSAALNAQENLIISAPAGSVRQPVPLALWQGTVLTYASHLHAMLTTSPAWIQSQVSSSARKALTILIVAASLGLLAVVASIVFSLLMGRRLLRRLNGLRQSALELAHHRLPDVMARLRDGETVDVDAEAPALETGSDEIDQVRQAFNIVHRVAVAAAVDEANMRRGVSRVFRNLARRSQVLLHRQLGLLDGMERQAEEPEQLEDLFRIDHLTTRMRRHAEGLIVLAGDSPGRGWSQPVSFIDVVRAAVAEVEDYTRVRVEVRSKAALTGPAVADVVHLLAELIENATVFSPPNTVVRVQGEIVGRGFCIEVEDRGLGIADERLEEINRNLASLPAFDLEGSDRLGLFIAGRLAHRHDIKVVLRSSIYGGTTAVMIIPTDLIVTSDSQVPTLAAARSTLEPGAAVAALSSGNGHNGNGHVGSGYVGNGHAGNVHAGNGHADNGHADNARVGNGRASLAEVDGNLAADSGHPATGEFPIAVRPATAGADAQTQWITGGSAPGAAATGYPRPGQATPPEPLDQSGWGALPTLASRWAAESIQAGQAIATATELVPDFGSRTAPTSAQDGELPVRVRQASLAPQLRDRTATDSGTFQGQPASAEAVRSTMSAMQRGWELGRSAANGTSANADRDVAAPRHDLTDETDR